MTKVLRNQKTSEMSCLREVGLAPYTTLRIGGPAKFLIEAKTTAQMEQTICWAEERRLPWLVIGGGSNLLISDKGFNGLVIVNRTEGIKIKGDKILVMAGTALQVLVDFLNQHSFAGLEKLAGIPGTVGGALYGNAGAYGQTISDHLIRVEIFDGVNKKWLEKNECRFEYRESLFKELKSVILQAEFSLPQGKAEELKAVSRETMALRSKRYPPQLRCPGSFFKNVPVKEISSTLLKKIPQEVIAYGKIPSGYLLDQAGAKGASLGKIKIADYHANLFFNLGEGKAVDFFQLAKQYKNKVKRMFGVELEPEVQLVGFETKL